MIFVNLIILGNQVVIWVMETSVRHNHGHNSGTWVGLLGTCRTISFGLPPPILQCPGIRGEMGVHGSCIEVEPIPCTQRTLQATEPPVLIPSPATDHLWNFSWTDAPPELPVSQGLQGTAPSSPGPELHYHGICLAGRRGTACRGKG